MRKEFIKVLTKLAEKDKDIYLLTGDLGFSLFEEFIQKFPKRFINCGVAEQNMIGVAAGLAMEGKKPYIYSIIPFATMRCFEQIRNNICYQNLNVKIIGMGAGFSYKAEDFTHYAIEDMAILKPLPNLILLSPADAIESKKLIMQSYFKNQPVYMRMDKSNKIVHKESDKIIIGKPFVFRAGNDAIIITTGSCIETAINVAKKLEKNGINLKVIGIHTIKPIDEKSLLKEIQNYKFIFTLHEHKTIGGLGSSVAQILIRNITQNIIFEDFGVSDDYRNVVGSQEYLKKYYKIDEDSVYKKIINLLKYDARR